MPGTGRTGDSISVRGVIYDFVDGKWEQQSNGANAGVLQQEIRVEVREREAADEDFLTESQINELIEAYGEPFTDALLSKLNGLEALRNAAQTYALIEASLNTAIAAAVMDFLTETEIAALIPDVSNFRTESQINELIEAYGEPFTDALLSKLNGLEALRNAAQTYALIEASLNTAIAAAVMDFLTETEIAALIPDVSNFRTESQINTLIEAYGEPFTTALLNKLGGIEENAKGDLTADEIVDLIEAQTGDGRLDANALKNLVVGEFNATAVDIRDALQTLTGNDRLEFLHTNVVSGTGINFSTDSNGRTTISANAMEITLSAQEIRDLLQTLTGNARLEFLHTNVVPGTGINFSTDSNGRTTISANAMEITLSAQDIRDLLQTLTGNARLEFLHTNVVPGTGINFSTDSNGRTTISANAMEITLSAQDIRDLLQTLIGNDRLEFLHTNVVPGTGINFSTDSNGRTTISANAMEITLSAQDIRDLLQTLIGNDRLEFLHTNVVPGTGINFSTDSNGRTTISANAMEITLSAQDIRDLLQTLIGNDRLEFLHTNVVPGTGINFSTDSNGRTTISANAMEITLSAQEIRDLLQTLTGNNRLEFLHTNVVSGTGINFSTDSNGRTTISANATEFLVAGTGISFTNLGGGRIRIDAT